MNRICANCIVDYDLKKQVETHGEKGTCSLCLSKDYKVIDWEDKDFRDTFRALIRYYFSEWNYNRHWGGESIESLFCETNPIIRHWPQSENFEDMILALIEPAYSDYDTGISMYSGYDEQGQQNQLLRSIRSDSHFFINRLSEELKSKNYYLLEDKALKHFKDVFKKLECTLPKDKEFFRARLNYRDKAIPMHTMDADWHYSPFENDEISAAPPSLAKGGRMNRHGVSFMYVATDEETAISEIRPHPGHYISVGKFNLKRKIKVLDFSSVSISEYANSDKMLDEFLLVETINKLFSSPVTPNEHSKYTITQFLSDVVRKLGYDGVCFKSSLGNGENYVFFDPSHFSYLKG